MTLRLLSLWTHLACSRVPPTVKRHGAGADLAARSEAAGFACLVNLALLTGACQKTVARYVGDGHRTLCISVRLASMGRSQRTEGQRMAAQHGDAIGFWETGRLCSVQRPERERPDPDLPRRTNRRGS